MRNMIIEDFFINTAAGDIYVKKWTPERLIDETPIVLLHDSLGCVALWKDFPEMLSRHLSRVVIAYDRFGFGQSSKQEKIPDKCFILEEATLYFPMLCEALKLDKFILFGHSVGGAIAITIAAHVENCLAVITEASQAFVENLTVKGIKKAKIFFEKSEQLKKLEKWHGEKADWVLHAWTDVWLSPEFSNWSLAPYIHKVTCPVLALHGDNDEYGSLAFPKFISQKTSGESKMIILNTCGHIPHKEKTQQVLTHTKELLGRIIP
ncbi:alpha/beta fold hydrolase [Pseudoalteromonas denitrificans]|uniref:Pimeloyl-ACP methyl ester carboxylesterase n=1 Tax=Pseudoalteromonas denitrificans DSM 6059 TaxID=1123010 RepID=A0A1I1T035_9GAMM|nr:alpha/beta hydrolase [Pseudoalteromonas denitrificans]SFD48660.1 Pimeloyl-ACP methyl ester carboxylesterase [Pseudoalteromonas denitrificans DSM 6059]